MSLSIDHKDANMPSPGASIAGVLCCESLHTTLLHLGHDWTSTYNIVVNRFRLGKKLYLQ